MLMHYMINLLVLKLSKQLLGFLNYLLYHTLDFRRVNVHSFDVTLLLPFPTFDFISYTLRK